jgi:hypothetical protein
MCAQWAGHAFKQRDIAARAKLCGSDASIQQRMPLNPRLKPLHLVQYGYASNPCLNPPHLVQGITGAALVQGITGAQALLLQSMLSYP